MILIKPQVLIEYPTISEEESYKLIERIGRTCYKSEDKITKDSSIKFIKNIIKSGHESVIEHFNITVRIICDRGVSHELVRHRIASFSQESTRYVNYQKKGMQFILPPWVTDIPLGEYGLNKDISYDPEKISVKDFIGIYPKEYEKRLTTLPEIDRKQVVWLLALLKSERYYNYLISNGWKPQEARSVLPNSLKTEIVTTTNVREWRHILKLRLSPAAHSQMREIMNILKDLLIQRFPIFFEDIIT